jgi:hypothetical protein
MDAADKVEIHELVSRYCHILDNPECHRGGSTSIATPSPSPAEE